MSRHLKLEYARSRRSDLEKELEKVQAELAALIDVTLKDQCEKRLNLLFQQIEQIDREIESLQGSLHQGKIDRLMEILQPGDGQCKLDVMRAAYKQGFLLLSGVVQIS